MNNKLLVCTNCSSQGTISVLAAAKENTLWIRRYSRKDTQIKLSNTSAGTISCGNCNTDAYTINNGTVTV